MLSQQLRLMIVAHLALASADSSVVGKLSFFTSAWEGWNKHVARWSAYEAPTFSIVFKPETEDELSQGIAYLSRSNIPYLATKGGGHGNVPTLGSYQKVVQINMDNFRHVTINSDQSATVGGGAKMVDLIPTLHAVGREMTVGSFPCVGVHGVMLGGGMGRLMGKYGLLSDALKSIKLALWNGTIVEASDNVNSDLFWGLRGAGHNLGVVVESTFKTWPDEGGMHYNADMVFTDDSLEGVVELIKRITEGGIDPSLFLILGYVFDSKAKKPVLMVNIVYAHNEAAGSHIAAMFASTTGDAVKPITRVFFNESYIDFTELGSGHALPGVCDLNLKNTLYTASTSSIFEVGAMKHLYESYKSFIRTHPAAKRSILLFEAASGHAVAALPDNYSSYPHRGKMNTNAIIQMTWEEEEDTGLAEAASTWGRSARDLLAKAEVSGYDRLYAYVNYANKDEPLSALYGYEDWRHKRLTALKQTYDPHGFFNAYRAVPSELSAWEQATPLQDPLRQKDEL
ncbi:hypothetical protein F4779DRAFT_621626 [Xylariaceae sp. FL0662B]|nr:hypothetical protein F4779DRAFT_621626 [Xylariaceae sp. FL0662B]